MFKKKKTFYVTISSDKTQLNELIDGIRKFDKLYPILADEVVKNSTKVKTIPQNMQVKKAYSELETFTKQYKLSLESDVKYTELKTDKALEQISKFKEQYLKYNTRVEDLELEKKKQEKTIFLLGKLDGLKISLDEVFDCEFLVARLGKISVENSKKIKYYQNIPFIFESLNVEQDICWCLYATTQHYERQVDNIFANLFFERIHLPGSIHELPKEAVQTLENEIKDINQKIEETRKEQATYFENSKKELSVINKYLEVNESYNQAYKYVVDLSKRISISGYMDSKYLDDLHKILKDDRINILALPSKEKEVKIFKKDVKI